MKNFNLFSNKHFRFAAVLCLTIVLATSNAWGASPWTWTASSGDFGSSPGSTTGSVTLNGESWSYTRDQAGYIGFDNSSIQFGSKSKPENVTLSTSAFSSYTITGISVKASSYGGSHKVTIKVGGETVKSATNLATPTSSPTAISTGTISKTGNISIEFTNKNRALYIQQISVTYTSGSTKTLVFLISPFMSP